MCSVRKRVLRNFKNLQENTCARVSFLIKFHASVWNFIKKETLVQVFSCEVSEISMNTFFTEHIRATISEGWWKSAHGLKISVSWIMWSGFCRPATCFRLAKFLCTKKLFISQLLRSFPKLIDDKCSFEISKTNPEKSF